MEIPLKIKWLGEETADVCGLLAPFHPLILISPAPHGAVPHGLIALPGSVSDLWDLQLSAWATSPGHAEKAHEDARGLSFDCIELSYSHEDFSAIYEFYFQAYLRNTAVRPGEGSTTYQYIEAFHEALFERRFVALIRASHEGEVVGGCLLRHTPAEELRGDRDAIGTRAGHEAEGVTLDVICPDVRFKDYGADDLLIFHAARWAREAGFSFLSTTRGPALAVGPRRKGALHAYGSKTIPVFHQETASFLYCDLRRCAHLQQDFYYYTCDGETRRLHYVANDLTPGADPLRLLNSVTGVEKRAYTRHVSLHAALSAAGIACELVRADDARGG